MNKQAITFLSLFSLILVLSIYYIMLPSQDTQTSTNNDLNTIEELQIAFNAGLRIFPIQQSSATSVSYFTEDQAIIDVNSAYNYATNLGIPEGTIIYFAVDFDATEVQINSLIIPYFRNLYSRFMTVSKGRYRVGVYGTRNLCN